ncbi:MAG: MFS transporter [Pseudomonadota bacterium]
MNTNTAASKKRAAFALAPGLIAFSMGQTVLFAVAGPVIREIGLTEFQLGLIVSAAAVMFVLVSPIWGGLSDRFGRKRVIVFGLLTYTLISFAFALVMDIGLRGGLAAGSVFVSLLGLRLLYAALGAGIQPASVALMADLSEEKDRSSAVAIVGASFGFGMILGPAAAATLVGWGVLTPLYAIAGLGFVCMLGAAIFLPQTKAHRRDESESDQVQLGKLVPVMGIALFLFVAVSALQQTIAFYVQDYLNVDAADAARMTGYCFVAMATASLLVQGGLIQVLKPGPSLLLKLGLPIMAIGIGLYAFPIALWQIIVACAIIGVGFGLANPGIIAAASLRTGTESQGAAAGIMQAMMSAGYIFGPLAGTGAYEYSPLLAAIIIAVCLGIATLIALSLKNMSQS